MSGTREGRGVGTREVRGVGTREGSSLLKCDCIELFVTTSQKISNKSPPPPMIPSQTHQITRNMVPLPHLIPAIGLADMIDIMKTPRPRRSDKSFYGFPMRRRVCGGGEKKSGFNSAAG